MPSIWDDVRRTIDERANTPRQFILAGYTQLKTDLSKTNSQQEVHHSGAGWKNPILRLKMGGKIPNSGKYVFLIQNSLENMQYQVYKPLENM